MTISRRSSLPSPNGKLQGQHAGLVLTRYLSRVAARRENGDPGENSSRAEHDRLAILQSAKDALSEQPVIGLYNRCFERWEKSLPESCCRFLLTCQSPMIIGLGGASVLETGLTLHHTYGVPYLPGTALKGIAARYARQFLGSNDPSWRPDGTAEGEPNHFRTLFGTTDEGGMVQFLDGWLTSLEDCLVDDVMTPHHPRYYGDPDATVREPSDFDNPTPIPFLSVRGTFLVAICPSDSRLRSEWLDRAAECLCNGLNEYGIGGKTNAGYGWVEWDEAPPRTNQEPDVPAEEQRPTKEVEIWEVTESKVTVTDHNGEFVGTIRNHTEIPSEYRQDGKVLVVRIIDESNPENTIYEFVEPASPKEQTPEDTL